MNAHNNAKDRIRENAIKLFALKGYHGVGLREIAEAANVNVAMISYYYGGKIGLLKSLIQEHSDSMRAVMDSISHSELKIEPFVKQVVDKVLDYTMNNIELSKVVMREVPYNEPEIEAFQIETMKMNIKYSMKQYDINSKIYEVTHEMLRIRKQFQGISEEETEGNKKRIHAIMSSIFSGIFNYLVLQQNTFEKVFDLKYDKEFIDLYKEVTTQVLTKGITSIVQKKTEN
jgi:AcrR family transcriptional regulator